MRSFTRISLSMLGSALTVCGGSGGSSGPSQVPTGGPPPVVANQISILPEPDTTVTTEDLIRISLTLSYDFSHEATPATRRFYAEPVFHNPDTVMSYFSNGYQEDVPPAAENHTVVFELTMRELVPYYLDHGQCIRTFHAQFWRDDPGLFFGISQTETVQLDWCYP